jgi:hypothetical protein
MTGYRACAESGDVVTWETVQKIELEALTNNGMEPIMAYNTVQKAIAALKAAGVPGPTRFPWGR